MSYPRRDLAPDLQRFSRLSRRSRRGARRIGGLSFNTDSEKSLRRVPESSHLSRGSSSLTTDWLSLRLDRHAFINQYAFATTDVARLDIWTVAEESSASALR